MKKKWFIGIDISKKTLDIVICYQGIKRAGKHFKVANDLMGFKTMLNKLIKENVVLSKAIICLEYCGIYGLDIGFFLEGKVTYCFCAPLRIKRSLGLSRGKNDKIDAFKIAQYCYRFQDELSPTKMPTDKMLKLKFLIGERNRVIKARTVEKIVVKELSSRFSSKTLTRTKKRTASLTKDLNAIEKEMIELINADRSLNENYNLLISVVGIGIINAILMILYTNNFKGITNARAFACYCGVAPFEHSSGTSIRGKTKVSELANKKIKANLSNAARSAIMHDPELKIYYNRKKNEGKAYGTVLNAVKFKMITRAFAVINRKTPYVKLRTAG